MDRAKQLRVAFLLGCLSFVGGFTIYFIIDDLLGISVNEMMEQTGLPLAAIASLGGLQVAILSFILAWIGLRLGQQIGLKAPLLHRLLYRNQDQAPPRFSISWAVIGAMGAIIGSLLIMLLDRYLFLPFMAVPEVMQEPAEWWKGVLTIFYGGVVEEVQVRLFLMTLIAWVLIKLFHRHHTGMIPSVYYWVAIVTAATIFGLLHLPATEQAFGELTPLLVARGIVLNSLLGIFFGYLFWKKGLEYAILSHMVADLCLHAVFVHFI
ncbi:CPBP family glutamic-type intramembrane protease [Brevibacillus humidisoli]|uniref:CPBP family intramembrane glutamic endopeptidase n=1 Tax=Brevibacillus humidisoli TaxID=2895522 RepID=UPI001E362080|nr:CPBP family intramembrane glutamic endopeptidase [Brevibacillus humidisoli]UFJ41746.1 CPBP family glutamic-type intramembrane protease [Brevibacillus humidisoli]